MATEYSVKCSYLELYNEEITDLLASSTATPAAAVAQLAQGGGGGLQIRDGDAHRRGIYVEGLSLHAAVNGAVGGMGWVGQNCPAGLLGRVDRSPRGSGLRIGSPLPPCLPNLVQRMM